ncbi:macrolide transport system ATP-binding/permease protein [Ereboglobus sp. PH5-5]|uniref:ATP-binding cassette domain-containing protein n=1 Tax=Ereboglobus sp. PH5-5 TaxID=2940529 RepID=UPI002405302A|nr:ATP-binding cassette domain-containing protein [Ereboglobus sp. PH5-5]MDF9833451.1 macrolide transport system ATP-binding/permease protein [Ereboglobus sp. PH5-5]
MSSAQLTLTDIEFSYPGMGAPIFENLTVQFPARTWTGIVGANGSGKTTLLQIATGALAPAHGSAHANGLALYVAQRTDDPPPFFEDFIWAPDASALKSRLRIGDDWPERWHTLSHGERKRAQIATAFWREPAILALDEPTNHIDSDARELLIQVLKNYHGAGILVSHDRELLDELCTRCLMLDHGRATLRPGNITEALAQQGIEEQTAQNESDALKHAAARLRAEAQRRRVIAEQKAAAARGSHQKKLTKNDPDGRAMRGLAKLTGKDAYANKLAGQMRGRAARVEKERASIQVTKRYETGIWIDGASYSPRDFLLRLPAGKLPLGENENRHLHFPELAIGGADRIALTGANGSGKSTLIRHILSNLQIPGDKLVRVSQEISAEDSRTLLEKIKLLPNAERGRIMTTISRLGSRPARLLESAQPSPGEIRKLLLALGIVRGPHLIVMDEPTNHMDLPSILCLEEALADCPCAMLLVSHDRAFLKKITRQSWHLATLPNGDTNLEILPAMDEE